jgi:esterase/lipase
MEKQITYSNNRGDALVGIHAKGDADVCVILSHGFLTDKDENTLYSSLAETLGKNDISSFRFDYTGHGESESLPLSLERMQSDFDASTQFMRSLGYDKLYFVGHSLGAVPLLRSDLESQHCFLLAPYYKPDHRRVNMILDEFNGDEDEITMTNRFDVDHTLSRSFLDEMNHVDLLSKLKSKSSKTTIYLSNNDEIMPDDYYKPILDSKKDFNNIVLLDTNHFFSKNRKPVFEDIISLIKNKK